MIKRFRLKESHHLFKRLTALFDAFDKQQIQLDFLSDGVVVVMDMKTNEEYQMSDIEDGVVGHLPPVFEYKLTTEKDVAE